jgi:hypothetical protein
MPLEKTGARQFRQTLEQEQSPEAGRRTENRAIRQFGTALNSQSMASGVLFRRCLGQRMVDEFTDLLAMAHFMDQRLR